MIFTQKSNLTRTIMKAYSLFLLSLFFAAPGVAQTYDEWIDSSFVAIENGKLADSESAIFSALRLEPANQRNVFLWSNLGTIQRQMGKHDEAIESYTIALAQNPKSTTLLRNRAALFGEVGKPNDALTDYTAALLLEPDNEDALYYRGLLYLHLVAYDLAEADFKRLMELNDESYRGRKGYASLEKFRGNYTEAEKIYNFLINKLPNERELYIARAELYMLTNRNARAMGDINKVISGLEPDPYCYYLRARVKLALYERKSAAQDLIIAKEGGYPIGDLQEVIDSEKAR